MSGFNGDSRTADKFVVRLPGSMREQIKKSSESEFISMNSFIVQAIQEKLDRESKAEISQLTVSLNDDEIVREFRRLLVLSKKKSNCIEVFR